MKINRLFEIVYLLMDKRTMTAKKLAEHFEVSYRTILRDIDTLSAAGIPVYTTQGKGGGISILEGYILNKTVISEEEQNQILFALQGMTAVQSLEMEQILSRLKSLFKKTDASWIEADFSRWGSRLEDKEKFEILKGTIIKKRVLTFCYYSSYGEMKQRRVYPLKLVFKSKSWYLQAFCSEQEQYRTFKISRMRDLKELDEPFTGEVCEAPEIETDTDILPSLKQVKLKFSSHIAYRVYDEFDERKIIKDADGSFLVSVELPEDEWLYGYILSFGTAVEVIEPQRIRKEITRLAEQIQKKYSNQH